MREHPEVDERLRRLPPSDSAVTCPIVRGEILFGTERLPHGNRRHDLEAKESTIRRSRHVWTAAVDAATIGSV